MKKGFQFISFCIVLISAILVFSAWPGSKSGAAEQKKFLADRHQAKKIECAGCHKESPPKAAVTGAMCMKCHGTYAKVAKQTDKVTPNPHASHMGELACEECHHGHKPSVDRCAECHEFGFKVP
ncbi:MAG: cytochrome c3 family protein [Syntrophaceae bacterium]